MRGRKKLFWVALATTIILTVGGGIWWSVADAPSPQVVTLPNGLKFRFAGVTYGTNNVPPSLLAKAVHWLPKPLAARVRQYALNRISQFNEGYPSPKPRFYVWFERVGTTGAARSMTSVAAMFADEAGVEAGAEGYGGLASSAAWACIQIPAVPRRSRVIQFNLYANGSQYNSNPVPFAKISFPNPFFSRRPTWQPEPIPAVKQSGDMEVWLEKFGTGTRVSSTRPMPVLLSRQQGPDYRPARGGPGVDTYFDVTLKSTAETNEAWVTQAAELSDAAGNVLWSPWQVSSSGNVASPLTFSSEHRMSIPGTLWPDEGAWRLKLWVKRKLPLGPGEYVAFQKVPVPAVGATNWTPITNAVSGVKIVLTKFSP